MKKEFLLGLGIAEDIAKQIMSESAKEAEGFTGKITQLTDALNAQKQTHTAELLRRDRESETAAFLAGKKFINAATRDFYGMKLNSALEDKANTAKSREELLKAMTTGEDGNPLENIFEPDNAAKPRVPPTGRVTTEDVARLSGGIGSLQETIASINAHRITGK